MSQLLDKITCPADLKKLSPADLVELADEIRHEIISTVTATGGHLASNLGVVELTIAGAGLLVAPEVRQGVGAAGLVPLLLGDGRAGRQTGRGDGQGEASHGTAVYHPAAVRAR